MVNVMLERGWGVVQIKRHHEGFEKTELSDKCCFPFVTFYNSEFVENCYNIEIDIEFDMTKYIESLVDE